MTDTANVGVAEEENDSNELSLLIHGKITAQEFVDNVTDVTPELLTQDIIMILTSPDIILSGSMGEDVPLSQFMQVLVDALTILSPDHEGLAIFNNQITSLRYLSGDVSLEDYFNLTNFEECGGMKAMVSETEAKLENHAEMNLFSLGQKVEFTQVRDKMSALVQAAQDKIAA